MKTTKTDSVVTSKKMSLAKAWKQVYGQQASFLGWEYSAGRLDIEVYSWLVRQVVGTNGVRVKQLSHLLKVPVVVIGRYAVVGLVKTELVTGPVLANCTLCSPEANEVEVMQSGSKLYDYQLFRQASQGLVRNAIPIKLNGEIFRGIVLDVDFKVRQGFSIDQLLAACELIGADVTEWKHQSLVTPKLLQLHGGL